MSESMVSPKVSHGSFTIERLYPVAPARVFAAFAQPEIKARWFRGPEGWTQTARELDFRVGGREVAAGAFGNGMTTRFECRYHQILPDQRIVWTYDMFLSGRHISTSLATAQFQPSGKDTRLIFTEQGAFLDYEDGGSRENGTRELLERIATVL